MRYCTFFVAFSLIRFLGCSSGVEINYLNQTSPQDTPKVFAQGLISKKGTRDGNAVFAPDGSFFLFMEMDSTGKMEIKQMDFRVNQWSAPKTASFSNAGDNWEPFITMDSESVLFTSNRTTNSKWNGRIWKTNRTPNGWSEPEMLHIPVTTEKGLWFPTVGPDNKLYFGGFLEEPKNLGLGDLYTYDLDTHKLENLEKVNSSAEDWDPFISPDGSYLLFASNRKGGYGKVDIYVSFKTKDGWGVPVNLGSKINTSAVDVAAKVTPDGKYILFDRPTKADQDVYWVSAKIIDSLRN